MIKYIIILLFPLVSLASGTNKEYIVKICKKHKYHDCDLVVSIMTVESGLRPWAYNSKSVGAYGLGQIQCPTARFMGMTGECEQLFTPSVNIKYAIKYLLYLASRYDNIGDVVSAYNVGHVKLCKYTPMDCYSKRYMNWKYVKKVLTIKRESELLGDRR